MTEGTEPADTIYSLLEWGAATISATSSSPRLDAQLLLAEVTQRTRTQIIAHREERVTSEQQKHFRLLVGRRRLGVPVAYLTGRKEFYGVDFEVTPAVLVPRPETELLVEQAVEYGKTIGAPLRLIDLGTGSGCIAIAVALELRKLHRRSTIVAVDKSRAALEVARRNINRHGVADVVKLVCSDWFDAVLPVQFDVIISNPPYIAVGDSAVAPEVAHEPSTALYAGRTGLDDIRKILSILPLYLKRQGVFLCEIGADQGHAVCELWSELHPDLAQSGFHATVEPDLTGRDRVVRIQKANP